MFTLKVMFFKLAQKLVKYLGYLCYKICGQELSKSPNLVTLHISSTPHGHISTYVNWSS